MAPKLTAEQQEHLDTIRAYKDTFSTISGGKVLDDMKDACYYNQTTFNPDNREQTLVREGMRCVVLMIEEILNLSENDIVNEITPELKGETDE